MKKLLYLLIYIPVAIVLIILSVANRQSITLSLDPFNTDQPALSVDLPFFVFLFAALLIGMLIGSVVTWFRQGSVRKALKQSHDEVERLRQIQSEDKQSANTPESEIAPGLPMVATTRSAA